MGADTVSIHRGESVKAGAMSKMFRLGEMLVGSSGTVRCHQITQHLLTLPALNPNHDTRTWVITEFAQALRVAMKEHGGECKSREGNDEMDARLLIALRGLIFHIDTGYGVFQPAASYGAVGCADQEAEAAMLTALKITPDMHARMVVQLGLEAAAALDINIRPPFEILCSQESVAAIHAVA